MEALMAAPTKPNRGISNQPKATVKTNPMAALMVLCTGFPMPEKKGLRMMETEKVRIPKERNTIIVLTGANSGLKTSGKNKIKTR